MRHYGAEKLSDLPGHRGKAEQLYAGYYARFLQEREEALRGSRQIEALEAIAAEIENLRLAWQLAGARGNEEVMGRSLVSLGMFYAIRCWHREGARAFGQAVEGLLSEQAERGAGGGQGEQAAALGASLAWQGHFVYQLGEIEQAQELLEKSLQALSPPDARRERAFSLLTLAQVLCFGRNEYGEAEQLFRESLDLYQGLGDRYGSAQALDGLGDIATRQGKPDEAKACYQEGLALRQEIGDLWGLSVSLGSLGGLAGRLGNYDEAQRWFQESLDIGRVLDNPRGVAASLHNLSTLAYLRGEFGAAKRLRRETLDICRQIGYRWGIAGSLKSLGDVAYRLGEHGEARAYLLESLTLVEESGDRRSQAYTLNSLGQVALTSGDYQEAMEHLRRALAVAIEINELALALAVLGSLAQLASQRGEEAAALELAAFVLHQPASEQQTRTRLETLRAELASRLPTDAAIAAEVRGAALDLDSVVRRTLGGQPR